MRCRKMKKKWKIFVIVIGIILMFVVLFFILSFMKEVQEDQKETKKIMENIKSEGDALSKTVEEIAPIREEFYKIKQDMEFLDTMQTYVDPMNEVMDRYETTMKNIEKNSKNLQEWCKSTYADKTVNNACDVFRQEYEAANNYYIKDLMVYQDVRKAYETNFAASEKKLKEKDFLFYRTYIDYDEDGMFLGGNDEKTNE